MKNIKRGLIVSLILLAGCASNEINKTPNLTDSQIKMIVVGKTLLGRSLQGGRLTVILNTDGTVSGSGYGEKDTGIYTIKDGKLCSTLSDLFNARESCWTIRMRSSDYFAKLVSGDAQSFKFTVK